MPTRQELALAVGRLIQKQGGVVTSLLPPPPGQHIVFEVPPPLSDEIPARLRELGYHVTNLGGTERLHPHAHREEVRFPIEGGADGTRVVYNPGIVMVTQFELVLPSDAELTRLIAPGNPPKPKPHRQDVHPTERQRRWRGCSAGRSVCETVRAAPASGPSGPKG
jgi:hypothetical protein